MRENEGENAKRAKTRLCGLLIKRKAGREELNMKIKATQEVIVDINDSYMKDAVNRWLYCSIDLGEHDYINLDVSPPELVRQEDRGAHKTEYHVIERRPATELEIHVSYVLQAIYKHELG